MDIYGVSTLGNVQVKRVHVDVILLPRKFLIVPAKAKSSEIGNGTVRGVVRGQPLRVVERERTGGSGYVEVGMEYLLRRVGGVDVNCDGPRGLILSANK